jgi:uncharacterized membrane protein YwzB
MINYILALSIFLNAVMIMTVVGILPFILFISILFNALAAWYVLKLIKKEENLQNDVLKIFKSIESFSDHLESIHELEAFYGDQNLQNLIQHSRELINQIVDLQEDYYDDIETEMETYDEDNDDEEDPGEEKKE